MNIHAYMLHWSFTQFIASDRYPKPVGVLIDRDDAGHWEAQQVARWDDAREAERRYGELPVGRWNHLEWVR